MTTLDIIFLSLVIGINAVYSWWAHWSAAKLMRQVQKDMAYVKSVNNDFAEAAALFHYGAIEEAIEVWKKHDREQV